MRRQLELSSVDDAARTAIAEALGASRAPGSAFQAVVEIGRRSMCVHAVVASAAAASDYSRAAASRAEVRGRHLLPVLGSGELDGCFWIAYDMRSTKPLAEYRKQLLLPTETCLRLLAGVARALDEAAGDGLFPFEVGPDSMFVSRRGARLADLGTAREAFGAAAGSDGAYVPPEVLRGRPAGERSGVYVFGALLYRCLAGVSPPLGRASGNGRGDGMGSLAAWRPDLPEAVDSVVAAAMAEDPHRRLRSAGEACDLARRALRGAGSGNGNGPRPTAPRTRPSPPEREPARRRDERERPQAGRSLIWSDIARPPIPAADTRPPTPGPRPKPPPEPRPVRKPDSVAKGDTTPPPRERKPRQEPEPRQSSRPVARKRRFTSAIGVALALGAATGLLLLGGSSDSAPARSPVVKAAGMSLTLPPGWEGRAGGAALRVSAHGDFDSGLQARLVDRPLERQEGATPVQLGALQAWRSGAPGTVRYAAPTTRGTLIVTCLAPRSGEAGFLRVCERAASTLTLSNADPLPLAGVVEEKERLRATIARLRAARSAGLAQLGRADDPAGQRDAARALARSHARAARALAGLSGAEPIRAAVLEAVTAYSALATAAARGSAARWNRAGDHLRERDATLDEALSAGSGSS